ncbi:hypothetical protein ACFP9V_26770 [Deinococcus radiopugnans]|uniref:Uncharacterized protein n=1 Tax=Deinococcus radiopugnans ATCC 19172 TaxID=585398 RepID=A0A5C4XEQ0_9DEIO|nr:hypothetical protein [Deinococcus radiopugnans]MBB6018891.1 hypothetical protein [Deinococcus radiopugnans ATCC 19172]TNM61985.1 hypothetical protein FHR04_20465 [Deinococcus radiopugnans ATCC 19172]
MRKLSKSLKDFGAELLRDLDNTMYSPTSMLWTDSLRPGEWALVIGTMHARLPVGMNQEEFDSIQNRMSADISRIIQESALENPNFDVIAISPRDPFLVKLQTSVSTGMDAIDGIDANNINIEGIGVSNNYVYRLHI